MRRERLRSGKGGAKGGFRDTSLVSHSGCLGPYGRDCASGLMVVLGGWGGTPFLMGEVPLKGRCRVNLEQISQSRPDFVIDIRHFQCASV